MSQKEDVIEMPIWQDHDRRITTLETTLIDKIKKELKRK